MSSYRPGQLVTESGIYRIEQGCAACPREVPLVRGERVPRCQHCGEAVYRLAVPAPPIELDPDFC